MKEKAFYEEKAKSLRETVLTIQSKGETPSLEDVFNPYPGIKEAILEFTHLVYSFDRNLPLNKDLEKLRELKFYHASSGISKYVPNSFDHIIFHIDFFLHYLNTYTD
ncbi:hypothetical protein [Bacteroides sp. 51]|uniref:hypothetical protein n=1 Tax=Bacteroides sp. 51 TaxID=2302938 RepID=UPI0013D6713F|nr:hypothetical protein [Bacteroides sp. 51]NDV81295.1 hypothetical protein [Bacteroides sp. 51]